MYFVSNKISKIEKLDTLVNLVNLELGANRIRVSDKWMIMAVALILIIIKR
jgi:hypothetical protein